VSSVSNPVICPVCIGLSVYSSFSSTHVISILLLYGPVSSVSVYGSCVSSIVLPSLSINNMSLCFLHATGNWCILDMTSASLDRTVQLFLTAHFMEY